MEENKEMLFDNTRKDANGDINSLEDRLWACANLISLEEHNYSSWLRTQDEFWLRDMEECRNMRQQLMTEILGEGSRHGEAELWCMFKHNAASAVRLWETGNRFASTPERANKYYEMSRNRIGAMLALMDTAREKASERYISCFAEWHAFLLSFLPRYCDAITAPPVAKAEKRKMRRFAMLSIRDTPETACSPTLATIIVSIIPMVTLRRVSIRSGTIRALRYLLSKSRDD